MKQLKWMQTPVDYRQVVVHRTQHPRVQVIQVRVTQVTVKQVRHTPTTKCLYLFFSLIFWFPNFFFLLLLTL